MQQEKEVQQKAASQIYFGKQIVLSVSLLSFVLLCGCSSADLNSAMNGDFGLSGSNSSGTTSIAGIAQSTVNTVASMILPLYQAFDPYATLIALASFILGCCMLFFFHNSKSMSKLAIFSFMILIPVIMIALDLGVGAWLSNCLY